MLERLADQTQDCIFILPVRFAFTYDMSKECDLGVFPNGQYLKGQGECFILSAMEGIEFGQEFYIFVYEKGFSSNAAQSGL